MAAIKVKSITPVIFKLTDLGKKHAIEVLENKAKLVSSLMKVGDDTIGLNDQLHYIDKLINAINEKEELNLPYSEFTTLFPGYNSSYFVDGIFSIIYINDEYNLCKEVLK